MWVMISASVVSVAYAATPRPDAGGLVGADVSVSVSTGRSGTWTFSDSVHCPNAQRDYAAFIGVSASTPSTISAAVTALPPGWAVATDPAVAKAYPTSLLLAWADPRALGDPAQLQRINATIQLVPPTGGVAALVFYTGNSRFSCPGSQSLEASPIGPAIPVQWLVAGSGVGILGYGCGYATVAMSAANITSRFLVTSFAGHFSDALPAFVCVAGQARPQLDVPAVGFKQDSAIGALASVVARKKVTVYCADTIEHFDNAFDVPGSGTTIPGASTTYLQPFECRWLHSKSLASLARGAITLAHEGEHMRGVADERTAECAAVADLPRLAKALRIARPKLKTFVADARAAQTAEQLPAC